MKMKSFAMLALVALLTASFAYIAPALADDVTNNGQTMEPPTDNGAENDMNQNNNLGDGMNNPSSNSASSDTGMPDTATGDDDY